MKIHAQGLALEVTPAERLNREDWCRVRVVAKVPGFRADFVAFLQGTDLRRFLAEVEAMYRTVGSSIEASLSSYEPGIQLRLAMQTLGGIVGSYTFQEEFAEGGAPQLTGGFVLDQSYLPSLSAGINCLLAELTAHET